MKNLFGICAAGLMLAAAPAWAADTKMVANLTGGEETPMVLTGAVGTASVTIDQPGQKVTVELTVYNLPSGSTAGHIHVGPKGVAGPVVLNFSFPPGRTGDFALLFRLTAADFVPRPEIGIATMDDFIQAITAGNGYVNVHTQGFPGGEIRGQLALVP